MLFRFPSSKQPARFQHVAAYHACMRMTLHKDAFVCRLCVCNDVVRFGTN